MDNALRRELKLADLLVLIRRRRSIAIFIALTVFVLAILACIVMTRRYTAKSVVQLQKSSAEGLGDLEGMVGGSEGGVGDSLTVNLDLQTEANILQSDQLALQVINQLQLESNSDFKPHRSILNAIQGLLSPRGPQDPAHATLENSPHRRMRTLGVFHRNLKVTVVPGTRLLEVSFSNRDPKVAASVVNQLVQDLIDFSFQTKFKATSEASAWLEGQLGDLRKQSENLQAQVVAIQKKTGLFGVGGSDLQGKPIVYSPVLDSLQQATATLSQAQLNAVVKGAVYQVAKSGNPELISELSGTSFLGATGQGVTTSLNLIQDLRTQQATLEQQVAQDSALFGSGYPKLQQEKAALSRVNISLAQESRRIAERARNDYEIAEKSLDGARARYDVERRAADSLNDETIRYTILQKEATQSQELYQDLLKRLKEAGITEGLHSSNVTVVDPASPPAVPSRPNVPLVLMGGLGFGSVLGVLCAFVADAIDNKVHTVEDVKIAGIPVLGLIPTLKTTAASSSVEVIDSSKSIFSEAIRGLRSSLDLSRSDAPPKVILVTSSSAAEGKSTLAINLAAAYGQVGRKVLLVEADMRRPVMARRLSIGSGGGLSLLLSQTNQSIFPTRLRNQDNVYVIPAGAIPPFPAELIASERFTQLMAEWRREYDTIIIDPPPVLPIVDARILSSHSDAVVIVARMEKTPLLALKRTYELLSQNVAKQSGATMGVVLNDVRPNSAGYYGYYGYYGYGKNAYYDKGEQG